MKKFLIRDWRKMEVHSDATETRAAIRKDEDGRLWEWADGGKRIKAKRVWA